MSRYSTECNQSIGLTYNWRTTLPTFTVQRLHGYDPLAHNNYADSDREPTVFHPTAYASQEARVPSEGFGLAWRYPYDITLGVPLVITATVG